MRTRSASERKAMFANMVNGNYRPINFAKSSGKSSKKDTAILMPQKVEEIVIPEVTLPTENLTVSPVANPIIETPFDDVRQEDIRYVYNEPVAEQVSEVVKPTVETISDVGEVSSTTPEYKKFNDTFKDSFTQTVEIPVSEEEAVPSIALENALMVPSVYRSNFRNESEETYGQPIVTEIIEPEYRVSGEARKASEQVVKPSFNPYGSFKSGLTEGEKMLKADIEARSKKLGMDIASGKAEVDALKYTGKQIGYAGKQVGRAAYGVGKAGKYLASEAAMVAAPAAAAFGATAGTGVTEALRETGDLITAPKREFYMPPGFQRVWTGEGDNYKMTYVGTPQMTPTHVNVSAGLGMPVGVEMSPETKAEVSSGAINRALLMGIGDEEKEGLVRAGTISLGKVFEKRRSAENMSPYMRVAGMSYKEAAEQFGRARVKSGSLRNKSEKQIRAEAIMSMPLMQAAEALEKHAKIEIVKPKSYPQSQFPQVPKNISGRPESVSFDITI
jgi:hypothetical protein